MKKVWVKKFKTFSEAEEFDRNYYRKMTPTERLETIQFLREIYFGGKYVGRKRLRRFVKVIQQK